MCCELVRSAIQMAVSVPWDGWGKIAGSDANECYILPFVFILEVAGWW